MQNRSVFFITLLFLPLLSVAQDAPPDSAKAAWSFSTSAYYYIVPDEKIRCLLLDMRITNLCILKAGIIMKITKQVPFLPDGDLRAETDLYLAQPQ